MGFPALHQWTPVTLDGEIPVFPAGDVSPASTDIVGNAQFPPYFFAADEENVYFRLRVNDDPRAPVQGFRSFAWGVLFDTDGNPATYEWLLAVNGLRNRIDLIENVIKIPNSWNDPAEGTGGGEPNAFLPIVNFDNARVTPVDDGSAFNGSPDFFLDWRFEKSVFFAFLGISEDDPLRFIFYTATTNNNYNKDSLRLQGFEFMNAWSDAYTAEDVSMLGELTVDKQQVAGPGSVTLGEAATWRTLVTVTNTGKADVLDVRVSDLLQLDVLISGAVEMVSRGGAVFDADDNRFFWQVGSLSPSESAALAVEFRGIFTEDDGGIRNLNRARARGSEFVSGETIFSPDFFLDVTVVAAGSIEGRTFDNLSGLALGGVLVELLDGITPVDSTVSDGAGFYSFTDIDAGNYTLQGSKDDYQDAVVPVTVVADTTTTQNLRLEPEDGEISGTVEDEDGNPVSNAQVRLLDQNNIEIASTTSGVAGDYSFTDILPGAYVLVVSQVGFAATSQGVIVGPAAAVVADLILTFLTGDISGTVVDDDTGDPVVGADITVFGDGAVVVATAVTAAGGSYLVEDLRPGSYTVRAAAEPLGFGTATVGVQVEPTLVSIANLRLDPLSGSVGGTVADELTGDPLEGATVNVLDGNFTQIATVQTDINGMYLVEGLAPGSYILVITATGYGEKNAGVIIVFGIVKTVDAALDPLPGEINGQVLDSDDNPLPSAVINIYDSANILVAITLTGQDGRYSVPGLAAGKYQVRADADGFRQESATVTVMSGVAVELNFILEIQPGVLEGAVTDLLLDPISGAVILVTDTNLSTVATTVADNDGFYRLTGLAPGNYRVTAKAGDFQNRTIGATIVAGETTLLNFTLEVLSGSIEGFVTDQLTGAPLASVTVQVFDGSGVPVASAVTDGGGEYAVTGLSPGFYNLKFALVNFQSLVTGAAVDPGETTNISPVLKPEPGRVSGFVTDILTGLPIKNVLVQARRNGVSVGSDITDVNGAYAIESLQPLSYQLTAISPLFQNETESIQIQADATTINNFRLNPLPASIVGEVRDAVDSNPISGATVKILDGSLQFVTQTVTDENGGYEVAGLAPGSYVVSAVAENYQTNRLGASLDPAEIAMVNLNLELNPGAVQGEVLDAQTGLPLSDSIVRLTDRNMMLVDAVATDPNGFFRFSGLDPGLYYTLVALAPDFQIKMIGFEVAPGEIKTVNIPLQPNPGAIVGLITDAQTGEGLAGAVINVFQGGMLFATISTDEDGEFLVENLPPGNYIVTARAANFQTIMQGATVVANATTALEISLQPQPGEIVGFITDAVTGNPIAGAVITVLDRHLVVVGLTMTASDGSYRVASLAPDDEYAVEVRSPGYFLNMETVAVFPGMVTVTDIELQPGAGELMGIVADAFTGDPIPGALVAALLGAMPVAIAFTGNDGTYRITDLTPANYVVVAKAEGFGQARVRTLVFPFDSSTADLLLPPIAGSIGGSVVDAITGRPLNASVISVLDTENIPLFSTMTNEVGSYRIDGLSPGSYIVLAQKPGFGLAQMGAEVMESELTVVSFALVAPDGLIRGRVTDAQTGDPLPLFLVKARAVDASGLQIKGVLTDSAGNYVIRNLQAGFYSVIAIDRNYQRLIVGANVLAGEETVVDLEVTPLPARIVGTVRDSLTGEPISGASVRGFNKNKVLLGFTAGGSDGLYQLGSLPAGEITLLVNAEGYNFVIEQTTTVSGETVLVDVFLSPIFGKIRVLVLEEDTEKEVPGAVVRIYDLANIQIEYMVTGGNGEAESIGLRTSSNTYNIVVSKEGFAQVTATVRVIAGETTEVVVFLGQNPGSLFGRVFDANTLASLTGALVQLFTPQGVLLYNLFNDPQANYRISFLAPGSYRVTGLLPGYLPGTEYLQVQAGIGTRQNIPLSRSAGPITDVEHDAAEMIPNTITVRKLAGDRVSASYLYFVRIRFTDDLGTHSFVSQPFFYNVIVRLSRSSESEFTVRVEPFLAGLQCFVTNTREITCCVGQQVLLSLTALVQLLVPAYGVCPEPSDCAELACSPEPIAIFSDQEAVNEIVCLQVQKIYERCQSVNVNEVLIRPEAEE
ncbi:carboxypeptidase regulatory-like domain-containing protein [Dethiobacter alkaliphilus]|uniref:carboxypeptidase regulatory-like domain-containing protein n=1 Tax=Dethiobacter alkaliphilus TaxID=427926 RepID=UPI002225E6E6|nr:carboxypeptidase regulatory-like domain-containing protein [Dethiobacter alkaliphilus]MCW3489275.1 carboxypeptidase regulatory-like domain-containing protein [Dethiobacter alkaliphilus]